MLSNDATTNVSPQRPPHTTAIRSVPDVIQDIATTYHTLFAERLIDQPKLQQQLTAVRRWATAYNVLELEGLLLDILHKYGKLSKSEHGARHRKLRTLYSAVVCPSQM